MTTIAVIPAYNEEVAIGSVVARTMQYVDQVLVIDDGSADFTAHVAELIGATVLRHEKNAGKGVALKTAFKWAMDKKVDILITIDADGQHNPDEIPRLLHPILWKEADMVIGSRFMRGHIIKVPKYRRLGQEILTLFTNMNGSLKTKISDSQSGFRAFSSKSFNAFKFNNNGMGIESEMLIDAISTGLKIKEVPISCRYDVIGSTFNPLKHGFSVLNSIIDLFQKKHPLLYFGVPGIICFFMGLSFAIKTLYIFQDIGSLSIGTALLGMALTLLGCFGMFTGLILNSISAIILNSDTASKLKNPYLESKM